MRKILIEWRKAILRDSIEDDSKILVFQDQFPKRMVLEKLRTNRVIYKVAKEQAALRKTIFKVRTLLKNIIYRNGAW